MLPVDVLELTGGRRRILSLKEHWIPLTSRRARLNGRAELFRELRRDPPSLVETHAAVNRLKCGKAPGICDIHAELLKAGGNAALVSLHAVLCSAWNTGIIPTDWKRGFVVPLWKEKGIARTATTEG